MKNFLLYLFALLLCIALLPLAPKIFPPDTEEPPVLIHVLETATGEVHALPLEDYVIGALTAAAYDCEGEALKAIAVATRSSAAYCELSRPVHAEAAVCDDPACCMAFTTKTFSECAVRAAAETAGLFVTYGDKPAAAVTHESAGTYTASSLSVYGVALPYLCGVKNIEENRVTEQSWSERAFLSRIGAPKGAAADALFLAYDPSGRVCAATFAEWSETGAGWQITGEELAEALSLPSCFFTLAQENGVITARCEGAGDGVGMSRTGASLLAQDGKDFREILLFYYPGTEIKPL